MKAPEKIYIDVSLDSAWGMTERTYDNEVEYTRTDAFIEKACEWLSNISLEDMEYKYDNFDTSEGWYKMITDFKKYMKGE